jgi:excisionase family DNA binding protein
MYGNLKMKAPLLTQKEAAEYLGISERTLMRHRKAGKLPAVRFGSSGKIRFKRSALKKFINDSEQTEEQIDGKTFKPSKPTYHDCRCNIEMTGNTVRFPTMRMHDKRGNLMKTANGKRCCRECGLTLYTTESVRAAQNTLLKK